VFKKFFGLLVVVLLAMCCMGSVCAQEHNGTDYYHDLGFKSFENGKTNLSFIPKGAGNITYVVNVVIPNYNTDVDNIWDIVNYNAALANKLYANGTIRDDFGESYGDVRHIPHLVYDELYFVLMSYSNYYNIIDKYLVDL
jgi:hypothetical protein